MRGVSGRFRAWVFETTSLEERGEWWTHRADGLWLEREREEREEPDPWVLRVTVETLGLQGVVNIYSHGREEISFQVDSGVLCK